MKCMDNFRRMSPHIADYVYSPKVNWTLSSSKLLTMEFMGGALINDLKTIQKLGVNPRDISLLRHHTNKFSGVPYGLFLAPKRAWMYSILGEMKSEIKYKQPGKQGKQGENAAHKWEQKERPDLAEVASTGIDRLDFTCKWLRTSCPSHLYNSKFSNYNDDSSLFHLYNSKFSNYNDDSGLLSLTSGTQKVRTLATNWFTSKFSKQNMFRFFKPHLLNRDSPTCYKMGGGTFLSFDLGYAQESL